MVYKMRVSPSKKERIDMTIERRFKEMARKLAKQRRRSVSGLFEDLIEEEMQRLKMQEKNPIGFHLPKGFPEGDCKSCRHFITALETSVVGLS
jgi:hypothetical protein